MAARPCWVRMAGHCDKGLWSRAWRVLLRLQLIPCVRGKCGGRNNNDLTNGVVYIAICVLAELCPGFLWLQCLSSWRVLLSAMYDASVLYSLEPYRALLCFDLPVSLYIYQDHLRDRLLCLGALVG
jgi:hypothetical protein